MSILTDVLIAAAGVTTFVGAPLGLIKLHKETAPFFKRRWAHLWRYRQFWIFIEAHVESFDLHQLSPLLGDATLVVRVSNFGTRTVNAGLSIERWAVQGQDLPHANITAEPWDVEPGGSILLTVRGNPGVQEFDILDQILPVASRVGQGFAVSVPASVFGWLTLTSRGKTHKRSFNVIHDFTRIRLFPKFESRDLPASPAS